MFTCTTNINNAGYHKVILQTVTKPAKWPLRSTQSTSEPLQMTVNSIRLWDCAHPHPHPTIYGELGNYLKWPESEAHCWNEDDGHLSNDSSIEDGATHQRASTRHVSSIAEGTRFVKSSEKNSNSNSCRSWQDIFRCQWVITLVDIAVNHVGFTGSARVLSSPISRPPTIVKNMSQPVIRCGHLWMAKLSGSNDS